MICVGGLLRNVLVFILSAWYVCLILFLWRCASVALLLVFLRLFLFLFRFVLLFVLLSVLDGSILGMILFRLFWAVASMVI